MLDSTGVAVYPWLHGETLTAAALNAAIAQSTGANVSTTPPLSPGVGTLWYNATTGLLSAWNGSAWQVVNGGTVMSDAAPASPVAGQFWWDSNGGELYVYYNDGTSSQWVSASNYSAALSANYLSLSGGTVTGPTTFTAAHTLGVPPTYSALPANAANDAAAATAGVPVGGTYRNGSVLQVRVS